MSEKTIPNDFTGAVKDIKLAILQARARAARVSNVEALKLYFYVGGYISKKTRNAKWGSGAIDALSERLQVELPGLRGFSAASIKYMRQFFEEWANWFEIRHLPSDESPSVLIRQLPIGEISQETVDVMGAEDIDAFLSVGFTHHIRIFTKCKSLGDRLYYIRRCAREHMTVIQLERSLAANEHLHVGAISNNFAKTLSPMALANQAVRSFRDEYLLDLINLDNVDARYGYETDERVLSKTMVAEIEKTIAALGGDDFCFMAREKRLVFKEDEFFVDLLFFHRGLKSMVAIELKKGDFHPGYLGQLNFYLSALDKLMKKPDENPTIGLLLCETVNKPVVELAVQGYSQPIGIATYRALRNIPEPYKTLAPVIDGVRRVLVEHGKEKRKSRRRKAK
jgi:predicted nuclease of restriction endonuclease-like (RecB) superfamily